MAIDSIDSFLAALRRVQLLAPEQVDEIALELSDFDNPRDLADYLIEIDWLTEYQCHTLFEGNWHALNLGPYQLLARLGEGGISEVFKAWDSVKGREVALKVLRRDLASHQEGVRQFQRKLEAVTRLSHPNVIKTFEAHPVEHGHCFAMEFVEGMDLHRYVTTHGPLPVEQACDFARQAAQGLQHAHQNGLVHRDIKPANLFLVNPPQAVRTPPMPGRRTLDPVVKILDWGLARMLPAPGSEATDNSSEEEKGLLIGTADFVAPEQARDPSLVDTRADIYSLGCSLFFLLAGRPPFEGTTLMQKLLLHQSAEPPRLRDLRPDVPEELEGVVQRMLAKRPEDRFQIPLLVVVPLRRFCPSALSAAGSLIRPTGSPVGRAPSTLPALGLPPSELPKPSSSAVLTRPVAPATPPPAPQKRPTTYVSLRRPGQS